MNHCPNGLFFPGGVLARCVPAWRSTWRQDLLNPFFRFLNLLSLAIQDMSFYSGIWDSSTLISYLHPPSILCRSCLHAKDRLAFS